jgi:hypothetical protein
MTRGFSFFANKHYKFNNHVDYSQEHENRMPDCIIFSTGKKTTRKQKVNMLRLSSIVLFRGSRGF